MTDDLRREAEALVNNCTVPAEPEEEQEVIEARWNEQLITDIIAFAKAQRAAEVRAILTYMIKDDGTVDSWHQWYYGQLRNWLDQRQKELEA